MISRSLMFFGAAAVAFAALPAQAAVNISDARTQHVLCAAGTCTPTAKRANLNVADLQNLLATSDVTVDTGAGAVTIEVASPLFWTSTHRLTLNADYNVSIKASVSVQGTAGLTVNYDNGGTGGELQFFPNGWIAFQDTSSSLIVNGNSYVLAKDLATLAGAVASNPGGRFALVSDYDASADGTYEGGIVASLQGTFEGLGHTVFNLSIHGSNVTAVGMFQQVGGAGGAAVLRDLNIDGIQISATGGGGVGALVGAGTAAMFGIFAYGTIDGGPSSDAGGLIGIAADGSNVMHAASYVLVTAGEGSLAGGLVGRADGPIVDCYAGGSVTANRKSSIGGLAGLAQSQIIQSFAIGQVQSSDAVNVGGLVGEITQTAQITDSYATGVAQGGYGSRFGGFVGLDSGGVITASYSLGSINFGAPDKDRVGGFIGKPVGTTNANDYWDVDTSGQSEPCGRNCSGITGLSDAELKSQLPSGFDPSVWAQSASVNKGYPYLIANPPQ